MNNEKGLTLVELIVSMAIASLIFLITSSFLMFGLKTHKSTDDEFTTQSNMRLLSTNVNKSIRNSSATFIMHKDDHKNLTDGWNYIMVSQDQKSVIKHEWDNSRKKHIDYPIVNEVDGTTFKIEYSKDSSHSKENLVQFNIIANINGKERILKSELSGLNSLQIVDKRTSNKTSNTIAYRLDPRPAAVSNSQASVAMVLDNSGSMSYNMNGGTASKGTDQRIYKLKQEANRLINDLSKNPNIYVSLNPFSYSGNGSQEMIPVQANSGTNSVLTNTINAMKADGGTNTGDGMRRAYHRIVEFNDMPTTTNPTKNFMIILVDGVTTYASVSRVDKSSSSNKRYFVTGNNDITIRDWSKDIQYNRDLGTGTFFGSGSSLDADGTSYVNLIGSMIKNYKSKSGEDIKVYVIGFSNVNKDHGSLGDIAKAASGNNKFYEAGDETALRNIFDMIQKDIDDSLWHIGGPL